MPRKPASQPEEKPRCPHGNNAESCIHCFEAAKEEKPQDQSGVNRHLAILGSIAVVWFLLFIFVVSEHSGGVRAVLPLVGLIFFFYLIYATVKILSKSNWWR